MCNEDIILYNYIQSNFANNNTVKTSMNLFQYVSISSWHWKYHAIASTKDIILVHIILCIDRYIGIFLKLNSLIYNFR